MEGVRDNRPGWNETVWRDGQGIVDPAKWTMTQGTAIPSGASFEVRPPTGLAMKGAFRTLNVLNAPFMTQPMS